MMSDEDVRKIVDSMSGWNSVLSAPEGANGTRTALAHIAQNQFNLAEILNEILLEMRRANRLLG